MLKKINIFLFQNTSFKQTVAKNSFWLLVGEFVSKLFTFFLSIWVARSLGVVEFGTYNFVITFVALFILVVDFGFSSLTFRELSKDFSNYKKYFTNVLFIKIIISIFVLLVSILVVKTTLDSSKYLLLIIAFLLHSILTNIAEFLRAFFRPLEKMEKEAFLKIINGLVLFIVTILFLRISPTIQYLFFGFLTSSIINLGVSLVYISKYLDIPKFSVDFSFVKQLLKMSLPFFLGGVFVYFYSDLSIILLKIFHGESSVGLFSAPYRLLTYIYILYNTVSLSMFKKLVEERNNSSRFHAIINKFAKYSLLVSIVLSVLFLLFGKYVLLFIYGNEFTSSLGVLQILSIVLVFKSISYVYGNGLTAISKEYTRLYIQIAVAIVSIVLGLLLIPKFGIIGAAFSLVLSEMLLVIIYFFSLKKKLG